MHLGQPSKNYGPSLLQKQATQQALLVKMRTRLAGGSEFETQLNARRKILAHKQTFNWTSRAGIALILILVNLAYLGYHGDTKTKVVAPHAEMLKTPSSDLSNESQALYWAYALYDFALLKKNFDPHGAVVIDAKVAKTKLMELLPKVDARTRFIIDAYLPPTRKSS